MTNPSKSKGTAAETAVVNYLREHGWPNAERRALRGGKDEGDIVGGPGVIEVKAAKTIDLSGWLRELAAEVENAQAFSGVLVVKRRGTTDVGKWYVIREFADDCVLAKEAGL